MASAQLGLLAACLGLGALQQQQHKPNQGPAGLAQDRCSPTPADLCPPACISRLLRVSGANPGTLAPGEWSPMIPKEPGLLTYTSPVEPAWALS